jgi:hypothetical protein
MNQFNDLPASSRVWVYAADRELSASERAVISLRCTQFASQWNAHKVKVTGAAALIHNRFIVFVADERTVGVSGCSIDSTVHVVRELGASLGVNFFDRFYTCYIADGAVLGCTQAMFSELYESGVLTDDTLVFQPLVNTLAELRNHWLKPLRDSWQYRWVKVSA